MTTTLHDHHRPAAVDQAPRVLRELDPSTMDELAHRVAAATEVTEVLDAVHELWDGHDLRFDPATPLPVLQRAVGRAHQHLAAGRWRAA